MKLFLRRLLALGIAALFASSVSAVDKLPPAASTPGTAVAGAAPTTGGCSTCAGSGHRVLHGRFGSRFGGGVSVGHKLDGASGQRLDAAGDRVERLAEGYLAFNERLGAFFTRMAGPKVDAEPTSAFGGGHKKGGPYTQPGTVVFPQHPFIRSPRDFFMTEQP